MQLHQINGSIRYEKKNWNLRAKFQSYEIPDWYVQTSLKAYHICNTHIGVVIIGFQELMKHRKIRDEIIFPSHQLSKWNQF